MENESKLEKSSHHNFLIQIKELLPVMSVMLIFLGYWNLDSYYGKFGIRIYTYITAAEILLSFLPIINIIFVTTLSLLAITFVVFASRLKNVTAKKSTNNDEGMEIALNDDDEITLNLKKFIIKTYHFFTFSWIENDKNFLKNILNFIVSLISLSSNVVAFGFVALGLILIYSSLYNYILPPINFYKYDLTIAALAIIIALRFLYCTLFENIEITKPFFKKYSLLITSVALLVTLISVQNTNNALRLIEKQTRISVTFNLGDKTIATDDNIVYIGNTQNYLFLRKLKEKTNIIYKMSEISDLEISDDNK